MAEEVHPGIVRSSKPVRQFEDIDEVATVAVFPDGRRIATNSSDGMVRIWDLTSNNMLRELEGRGAPMKDMALSRNGKLIASSDDEGYVIAWDGDTGKQLIVAFRPHSNSGNVCPLDFSPDGTTLAIGSDYTTRLWDTGTWKPHGQKPFSCSGSVTCVRYSPSGDRLAIATDQNYIYIWRPAMKKPAANLRIVAASSVSLVWTPQVDVDKPIHLLSGCNKDAAIRVWDSSNWEHVNDIWKDRTDHPSRLAINSDGTVIAFPITSNRVRVFRLSDRRTIAIFQHDDFPCCVAFSADGKHVFTGGRDKKISVWEVPEHAWPKIATSNDQGTPQIRGLDTGAQGFKSKIFDMSAAVRNACMSGGNLTIAEDLLTQEIDTNGNNYHSYANRSIVKARKPNWDSALKDAAKSLSIRPSLIGYISNGIALCGKGRIRDALDAFDFSSTFVDGDSYFISMIIAIALFNANQRAEAMHRVQELVSVCSDANAARAARAVEVYMHIQLGINALDRSCPSEAAGHFTAAVNTGAFLSDSVIGSEYDDLVILFGCDLNSLWQTANQKRCNAHLRAGEFAEVSKAYRHMVNTSNKAMMASCLNWTIGFIQEWSTLRVHAPDADTTDDTFPHNDEDEDVANIDIDDLRDPLTYVTHDLTSMPITMRLEISKL